MTTGTGIDGFVAVKKESSFATYVAPDRAYEFIPGSMMQLQQPRIVSRARRRAFTYNRTDDSSRGTKRVMGTLETELADAGSGLLLELALGSVSTDVGPPVVHTFTPGDTIPSFTLQKVFPDVDGNDFVFSYLGCQVDRWQLACAIDEIVSLRCDIKGADLDTGQSSVTGSASYPTTPELLTMIGATATANGADVDLLSIELNGSNNLNDRFYGGSYLTKERKVRSRGGDGGRLTAEFEDLTLFNHFVNSDDIDLVVTFGDAATSPTHKLVITAHIFVDGDTPDVADDDTIKQSLSFQYASDGTADSDALSLAYTTPDAVP